VKRYGKYSGRGVLHSISENTREKGRETPTSSCAWAHPSINLRSRDLRSLPVAMVLVLLYYYYSKKKARETEKKSREKKYGKKDGKKSTGKKKVREKNTEKKYGEKPGMRRTYFRKKSMRNRKKGRESPTSGCACAHPSTPSGHVTSGQKAPVGRETPTSGQKAPLGRETRLCMRAPMGSRHIVTSGEGLVTSGSSTTMLHHHKCGFVRTHILLI